jgi:ribonuclease HIII
MTKKHQNTFKQFNTMNKIETWIGTDESGKGDYFGPLVIAGVCINAKIGETLSSLGVKDSKKMTDKKVLELYPVIREKSLASDIVAIGPEKYNELYKKMKNLNVLLAWGHARVIENLLSGIECHFALTDQFGDKALVEKALMSRGKQITLEQRPRAEEDIAVAAASVLARGEFLLKMESLSKKEGMTLPRGASEQVVRAAVALFKKKGMDGLSRVAKLHFKTTQAVLGAKKPASESEREGEASSGFAD